MTRTLFRLLSIVTLIAFTSGCSHHQDLKKTATQDNFGVQMARMNLWREALFRFQRAVEINPQDAMAHNNLAVAWEANGDFEKARKEYLEALKLDRSNAYIQKNYSRFVEFLSRNRKRQQKDVKTASAAPTVPASATTNLPAGASQPGQPIAAEPIKPVTPPPPLTPPPAAPKPPPPGGDR